MANKKEFSELTRSRLNELYTSVEDVIAEKAEIELYGKTVTFEDIQNKMKNQPFITTKKKNATVNLASISAQDVQDVDEALDSIPKSLESAVMKITKHRAFPQVTFFPAQIKKNGSSATIYPPRMIIDVGDVSPNSGVRINTGYTIELPTTAESHNITATNVIKIAAPSKQPDFVIIPRIMNEKGDFIPAIYARDREDSGLYTVNFTSGNSGKIGKIKVVFRAYKIRRALNGISLINSEQGTSLDVFKPKDSRSGRFVKNLKIKAEFDTSYVDEEGDLLLSTFNSTTKPKTPFLKQKIKIKNITTAFTSRKREWLDSNLCTVSGIYCLNPKKNIAPKIAKGSDYDKNTHCLVFIESKLTLFSDYQENLKSSNVKIINGAFSDCECYKDVSKSVRQVLTGLRGLSVGAKTCVAISNTQGLDVNLLLKLCDYHRSVSGNDDKLVEKLQLDDKGMFNCKPVYINAYTANMFTAFKYLSYVYCKDLFTEQQLSELKLSTAKSSANEKRKKLSQQTNEEENDDVDGPKRKKMINTE